MPYRSRRQLDRTRTGERQKDTFRGIWAGWSSYIPDTYATDRWCFVDTARFAVCHDDGDLGMCEGVARGCHTLLTPSQIGWIIFIRRGAERFHIRCTTSRASVRSAVTTSIPACEALTGKQLKRDGDRVAIFRKLVSYCVVSISISPDPWYIMVLSEFHVRDWRGACLSMPEVYRACVLSKMTTFDD